MVMDVVINYFFFLPGMNNVFRHCKIAITWLGPIQEYYLFIFFSLPILSCLIKAQLFNGLCNWYAINPYTEMK